MKETSFSIESNFTNYKYDIVVYQPTVDAPSEGFPVIYVLDGLWYLPIAKQIVELQSRNSPKTLVEPSIVVGICHQEETVRMRRFIDFTAPADQYVYPPHTKGKMNYLQEVGGAENFHKFLTKEVKVEIEKRFYINKTKQTIYGHSLSGYYVLWSYLKNTNEFQTHLAVSPSLWWNDKELFEYLENANRENLGSVCIIVGEKEGFMAEDANLFYEKLPHVVRKELYIAKDENHASVVPSTMSRAFRFINK